VPEIVEMGAVYCAVQNMYLTATSYGVGGYLSTGGVTFFKESNAAFGLAPEDRIIGFFHVGIPKHHNQMSRRNDVGLKTTWVG
jgi:nitroreductase